jgi:hypothetical protein
MTAETVQSAGPFTTRRVWRRADGGSSIWDSRTARRRGVLRRISDRGYLQASEAPDMVIARRLGRLNVVASTAFIAGGLLFALGAAVAQLGSGDPTTSSAIYFAGGLCFNTGGYASLLQAINAPRPVRPESWSRAPGAGGATSRTGSTGSAPSSCSPGRWCSGSTCSTRSSRV